jgi:hypothetical protein
MRVACFVVMNGREYAADAWFVHERPSGLSQKAQDHTDRRIERRYARQMHTKGSGVKRHKKRMCAASEGAVGPRRWEQGSQTFEERRMMDLIALDRGKGIARAVGHRPPRREFMEGQSRRLLATQQDWHELSQRSRWLVTRILVI